MKKSTWLKIVVTLIVISLLVVAIVKLTPSSAITMRSVASSTIANTLKSVPSPIIATSTVPPLVLPLSNALTRVTKKPFGIKVSPGHSPVSPEKFSGYHTGVDFETLPSEANSDVPVSAVCSGPLLLKEWATGYGGVAVEKCQLNKQTVTIIYGHLRYSSITPKVGTEMTAGQTFAVLGTGYSTETDGERKHLHLGIHLGSAINILGYVQNQTDLKNWLDALKYLQ
jgi:hypothetical protein